MAVVDSELGLVTRRKLEEAGIGVPSSLIIPASQIEESENPLIKLANADFLGRHTPSLEEAEPSRPPPPIREQYASRPLEAWKDPLLRNDGVVLVEQGDEILAEAEARRQERLRNKRQTQIQAHGGSRSRESWKDEPELLSDGFDDDD